MHLYVQIVVLKTEILIFGLKNISGWLIDQG